METFVTEPKLVRIRSRGQLTIPQDMREALKLDENTGLNIFRVGKGIDTVSQTASAALHCKGSRT